MLSIAEWGGMLRVRNEIQALQIEIGEGIKERRRGLRSAYSSLEVPNVGEERGEEACSESGMK
jgi:hypothetical protein